MSGKAKRTASSPAEKISSTKRIPPPNFQPPIMPPKVTPQVVQPTQPQVPPKVVEGSLFKFEVVELNGKTFYGSLAECEIIHIWEKVLGRDKEELFAMSYSRSLTRNFKVTFKLYEDLVPADVYPEATFTYYRKPGGDPAAEDEALLCRIIGYDSARPVELGQLTRITVKTNDFAVGAKDIIEWLSKYGSVSVNHDYEKNSVGVRTDIFETEIALARHIPEFLPIAGRKVQVSYPGIPKSCNNCFQTGHLKRNCKSKKRDWLKRVEEIRRTEGFDDSMFGGWIAILDSQ
jgi:hypothetical protein